MFLKPGPSASRSSHGRSLCPSMSSASLWIAIALSETTMSFASGLGCGFGSGCAAAPTAPANRTSETSDGRSHVKQLVFVAGRVLTRYTSTK